MVRLFELLKKQPFIYLPFVLAYMNRDVTESKMKATLLGAIGSILGLLALSTIVLTQSTAVLIPLLFAPVVCGIFGLLLYASKPTQANSTLLNTPATFPIRN
jgi:hypothetical protein